MPTQAPMAKLDKQVEASDMDQATICRMQTVALIITSSTESFPPTTPTGKMDAAPNAQKSLLSFFKL